MKDSNRADHDPECKTDGDHDFYSCRIGIHHGHILGDIYWSDGEGFDHCGRVVDLTPAQVQFLMSLPVPEGFLLQ